MTTTLFETTKDDLHYLQLLSQSFPTIADASTENISWQISTERAAPFSMS